MCKNSANYLDIFLEMDEQNLKGGLARTRSKLPVQRISSKPTFLWFNMPDFYFMLMCYSFTPVKSPDGIIWLPKKVLEQYKRDGTIKQIEDDIFPGQNAIIWIWSREIEPREMRFDMVPRFYKTNLMMAEMLKRKASKKRGEEGFPSYNARSETILERASWKTPWHERKRMVVPVTQFRERPNEEDAPKEFQNKEYIIHLDGQKNLVGLYDRWQNDKGEVLDSFGIITVASNGNALLESIHHTRCPVILDNQQVEEWLDPKTPPERAMEMLKLYSADAMTLEDITKPKPENPQQSLF